MARPTIAWGLLVVMAAGCPRAKTPAKLPASPSPPPANARATATGAPVDDWYPADISLPAGVEYPCAVTALPADLAGIPDQDRQYVNHVYAVLIGVVREKQVLLDLLNSPANGSEALAVYNTATGEALARLKVEPVPAGLETFHQDVITSIELQRTFFQKVVTARSSGPVQFRQIPEGGQASQKLLAAWGAMEARYTAWSPAVKDSVYHHLCALDLY